MAAPFNKCLWNRVSRSIFHQCLRNDQQFLHVTATQLKSKPPDVCLSPDKNMIMCWHPEPDFPYEHTQPIPRDQKELQMGDSVLKVQYLLEEKLKSRPDGPTNSELSQIFHMPKYKLRQRFRREKKYDMIKYKPKDRDGI